MKVLPFIALLFVAFACSEEKSETSDPPPAETAKAPSPVVEAISFSGKNLYLRKAGTPALEKQTKIIQNLQTKQVLSEDDYLELGYAFAAINQFNNAIEAYSQGLVSYPDSYKLLRHRAHRFLSTRKVEKAVTDLQRALTLEANADEEALEYFPDGKIKGSYEYWIWYHLGLAHYLQQHFGEAAAAFSKCWETAKTPKNKVGATDWMYNSYHKAGAPEKAAEALEAFTFEKEQDMNYAYSQRVQLYKGQKDPEDLLDVNREVSDWTATEMTVAYGIANWYQFRGDDQMARQIYDKILETPYWNAWAYVVTDKEISLQVN